MRINQLAYYMLTLAKYLAGKARIDSVEESSVESLETRVSRVRSRCTVAGYMRPTLSKSTEV